jgi:large subunit ribosomal protein L4
MEVPVLNVQGKEVQKVDLPAYIFAQEVNEQGIGLMHQLFTLQLANARQGTHNTKRRGEVRGSTAKIYRQKGTGRARHGARTAPIFVGGGIAMGPKPRKYTKNMPKKMRRKAIRVALSALLNDEQLIFVDKLEFEQPKTRQMKDALQAITGGESALVVLAQKDEAVSRSVHNLPKAHVILASYLNIRDLLKYDKVVIPLDALEVIESIWGQEGRNDA